MRHPLPQERRRLFRVISSSDTAKLTHTDQICLSCDFVPRKYDVRPNSVCKNCHYPMNVPADNEAIFKPLRVVANQPYGHTH